MDESNETVADKTDYALHQGLKVKNAACTMPADDVVLSCLRLCEAAGS